ncbi:hypothetical protein VTP01DRAFT_330 [Rhizomucor pusillus]|uniref:uncharacterized protein n=1 Tax=Rhizomucor pusillus TaxID=4840 RepID=UPI0037432F76
MVAVVLSDKPAPGFKYGYELSKEADNREPGNNETLIKIQAAALNHRDLWILKGQYPAIQTGDPICSDGVGIVVKNGSSQSPFKVGQRVLINPGYGWDSDERGPEKTFGILGLKPYPGTLADRSVVETDELVACPEHLTTAEAAALPLAGLTAYRALFSKAKVKRGDHVLITGIGGGVALYALQFAVAAGAHVYVTSGSQDKIEDAKKLGAVGGVNYKDDNCIEELKKLLNGNLLSAIVDGAAGPLYNKYPSVLKPGAIIANYGQTATGQAGVQGINFTMNFVIKNIDLVGSTMGSRREFREMVKFVEQHKIKPIVSEVFRGPLVESAYKAIDIMKQHKQFGKLVIEIDPSDEPQLK